MTNDPERAGHRDTCISFVASPCFSYWPDCLLKQCLAQKALRLKKGNSKLSYLQDREGLVITLEMEISASEP